MRRHMVLVIVLVGILLVLPAAAYAQARAPQEATNEHVDAINEGDVDGAEADLAEDVTVRVPGAVTTGAAAPAPTEGDSEDEGETDPAAQQQYTGTAETQAYLQGQVAANGNTTLGECSVAGETVTCAASYTSDALQAQGMGAIEGTLVVTVVDGKIQSYDFTPSPDSVAMIQAASGKAMEAPKMMPASGGETPDTNYTVLVLVTLGLLLLLAGAATFAFDWRGF